MNETDKNKENEQIDDDILQGKEDILRARNIIPSSEKPGGNSSSNQPSAEKEKKADRKSEHAVKKTTPAEQLNKELESANKSTIDTEAGKQETEIPKFDLADQIMAEQRKITAVRRKGPGQSDKEIVPAEPAAQPKRHNIETSTISWPEEEKLIEQIVARDIQRLCRVG